MKKSLRDFKNTSERRSHIEEELKINLSSITKFSFTEEEVKEKNAENLIGATQIPLGITGPVLVNGENFFIPLATTEGALIASVSRGCKAINESQGATSIVEEVGITRGPVFKTHGIKHSQEIKEWVLKNFERLAEEADKTSSHLKLLKADFSVSGRNLFIRFYFNTQEAMGMNMATIACKEIVETIESETGCECISISGNFDIDKKAAYLNMIMGRGKQVWSEVILKKEVVKEILKTTSEKIVEVVYRKNLIGSYMSGSMGANAHFANMLAAIFVATGQDLAQIVEGSMGITNAEVLENGDLYFSIFLPALEIGTVGGGTTLPSQREALNILGTNIDVIKFAEIIGALVLAGEISLLASLSEGSLVSAHKRLGRKGK